MKRPLLLGHRGLRVPGGPAENTLAAFDAALEAGCDGFEFDVRQSSDGVAVICHDPRHGGIEIARSPANILNLPTLEQVLSRYADRAFFNIELKVPGIEQETIELVKKHAFNNSVLVSSFLPAILFDLHSYDSEIALGFICDRADDLAGWRDLPIECVIPHHSLVHPELVAEVHASGLKVYTWTVNQSEQMIRLAEWRVDAIISDNPNLLVQTLLSRK
jgi:glycerophosphoryl diester phosphodiesterase